VDEECVISRDGITVRGVNGRPKLVAPAVITNQKGIFVQTGADLTVDGLELTGARLPVDKNGAGIRSQGGNLTIRNCWIHDNDDGILVGPADGDAGVLIENSEFSGNGAGDGYSHNIYVSSPTRWFTMRASWSHDSSVGHLVKSRARETTLLYNRLTSEQGTTSYEVNIPNGGTTVLVGNLIEQGPNGQNNTVISYGEEGITADHADDLYIVNNTIVNDRSSGTFVWGNNSTTSAVIRNNILWGRTTLVSIGKSTTDHNVETSANLFENAAGFDYRVKDGTATVVDQGTDPGTTVDGGSLAPTEQYVHPASSEPRPVGAVFDLGAYELPEAPDAGTGGPFPGFCRCSVDGGSAAVAALVLLAAAWRKRRAS
jgi:MYXO-CTERM domain-containing protein